MQKFHIQEPYFTYIKKGIKQYEGKGETSRMAKDTVVGEKVIIFTGPPKETNETVENHYLRKTEELVVMIEEKKKYNTFKEMLTRLGVTTLLPHINSFEDGCKEYAKWIQEDENCYAIKLKIL